jgi:hypothetical protein
LQGYDGILQDGCQSSVIFLTTAIIIIINNRESNIMAGWSALLLHIHEIDF